MTAMDLAATDSLSRVEFDPRLQISPYTVYRRLDEGDLLVLVDLRQAASERPAALAAALVAPARLAPDLSWLPPGDRDVVFFDQDGGAALEHVRGLRSQGQARVWALFGGLDLWDLALGGEFSQSRASGS